MARGGASCTWQEPRARLGAPGGGRCLDVGGTEQSRALAPRLWAFCACGRLGPRFVGPTWPGPRLPLGRSTCSVPGAAAWVDSLLALPLGLGARAAGLGGGVRGGDPAGGVGAEGGGAGGTLAGPPAQPLASSAPDCAPDCDREPCLSPAGRHPLLPSCRSCTSAVEREGSGELRGGPPGTNALCARPPTPAQGDPDSGVQTCAHMASPWKPPGHCSRSADILGALSGAWFPGPRGPGL